LIPPLDDAAPPPPDAHLRETTQRTEQVFKGNFLDVRRDIVSLPDARTASREYVVHPGAVMVIPLLDDGRLVMERQWRHPVARTMLEFPAGKLEQGEPPLTCGIRELREETGYRATQWARAAVTHNAIAYSTEGIEIWFARGLSLGPRHLDAGEFLDVVIATQEELEVLAGRGELTDAKTLIGLMWLQNWRAGLWTLQWREPPADAAQADGR
jgi:ADP-ribose pyrophosphatase